MITRVQSATRQGIEAIPITIEVDVRGGLPKEILIGLPDTVIKESKNRLKSSLKNTGFEYPPKVYTIHLAPSDLPKEGAGFDLPIAAGILASTEQLSLIPNALYIGELALNGDIRPVRGIVSICYLAKTLGIQNIILPYDNLQEASFIKDLTYYPIKNLKDLPTLAPQSVSPPLAPIRLPTDLDFNDVKGQYSVKRALTIAAAGRHNILLIGSPGSGKSMAIKRLPSILPPLTESEAIETLNIHSISQKVDRAWTEFFQPPFRSPHHSISYVGLAGGGSNPQPGELSLAHNGILFLDELPEFERRSLEILRQPLEDKSIHLSRARYATTFPASFIMAAAMNPCPCGYHGDKKRPCSCTPVQIQRYTQKISGPLLDRIDLIIQVPRLDPKALENLSPDPSQSSKAMQSAIVKAQVHQRHRQSNRLNTDLNDKEIETHCKIPKNRQKQLNMAIEKGLLSGRSYTKTLKVARTLADLAENTQILEEHVTEALFYQNRPSS